MNVVYAESSAVLAWLLDEPRHKDVIGTLARADRVVTSALTGIECARALARAAASGRIDPGDAAAARRVLDDAIASWNVMDLSDDIAARARTAFPREPVRTLDAVHLATGATFRDALGSLVMLSLDERVRDNAAALGMVLAPVG